MSAKEDSGDARVALLNEGLDEIEKFGLGDPSSKLLVRGGLGGGSLLTFKIGVEGALVDSICELLESSLNMEEVLELMPDSLSTSVGSVPRDLLHDVGDDVIRKSVDLRKYSPW